MFVCFFSFINFLRCWCLIHFMVETACTMQPITVILLVLRQFFVQLNQVEWLLLAMSFWFLSIIIIMIMILMHSFRLLVYDCILYWNDWMQGICLALADINPLHFPGHCQDQSLFYHGSRALQFLIIWFIFFPYSMLVCAAKFLIAFCWDST